MYSNRSKNVVKGFNNTAGLLADKNHFSGIDIVRFGENISIIQKRVTFEHISVLEVYEKALAVFRDYYQYEVIQGADRKMIEKIPEAQFLSYFLTLQNLVLSDYLHTVVLFV